MINNEIVTYLQKLGNPQIAAHSRKFFRTEKGGYGEGDEFFGIRVPVIRQAVKRFKHLSLQEAEELLHSPIHEVRLFALIFLVNRFGKAHLEERKTIFELYLNNTAFVNNWDLVDLSAPTIVGDYLYEKDRVILYRLANSSLLWERRIAIMATFYFIRRNDFDDTLRLAEILLDDDHDLIHKAVGWMLREVGKRDMETERSLLKKHYRRMPRTMLRYAIEKFPPQERQQFLKGEV